MNLTKLHYRYGVTVSVLLTLLFGGLSMAEEDYELAKKLRQQGEILPLEKILTFARAKKSGEVIETELDKKNGSYVYEVEILDNKGQVWELKLDAKTGKLIKIELDD